VEDVEDVEDGVAVGEFGFGVVEGSSGRSSKSPVKSTAGHAGAFDDEVVDADVEGLGEPDEGRYRRG
jgi:hypothetical protein